MSMASPSWRARWKARVDTLSLDGQIIAAAAEGRARDLDRFLAQHPRKITVTGSQWNRPLLHIAAAEGHLDCVNVLLRRGFDIATRDALDNATALHWAAQHGTVDILKRLIDAGADVDGDGDAHEIGAIGWATPASRRCAPRRADYLLAQRRQADDLRRGGAQSCRPGAQARRRRSDALARPQDEPVRAPSHRRCTSPCSRTARQMVKLLLELLRRSGGQGAAAATTAAGAGNAKDHNSAIAASLIAGRRRPERARCKPLRESGADLGGQEYRGVDRLLRRQARFPEKQWEWGDPVELRLRQARRGRALPVAERASRSGQLDRCPFSYKTSTPFTRPTKRPGLSFVGRRRTIRGAYAK